MSTVVIGNPDDLIEALRPAIEKIIDEREAMRPDPTEGFLSVKKAAKLADIQPQTIRLWISQKKVKAYRVGRSVKVKLSDIVREKD